MAEFLDSVGKKISEVADELGRKASDTIESQKIKSEIRSLKRANERDFAEIGRMVFEKFQNGELSSTDYITICEAVEKRDEEVSKKEEELTKIREAI